MRDKNIPITWLFRFNNRYIFAVPGRPNFLTRDLVTLNYTLSTPYSPRPLATGRTRNAKIMRSPLTID